MLIWLIISGVDWRFCCDHIWCDVLQTVRWLHIFLLRWIWVQWICRHYRECHRCYRCVPSCLSLAIKHQLHELNAIHELRCPFRFNLSCFVSLSVGLTYNSSARVSIVKNKYNLEFLHPPQIIKPSMTFTAQVKTDKQKNSSVTLQDIFGAIWVNHEVMFHPKN